MKTKLAKPLLAILVAAFAATVASAYYDPHIGRFASRDPIQDVGSLNIQIARESSRSPALASLDTNPFQMARIGRKSPALETYAWRWDATHRLNIILGELAGGNIYVFVDNSPLDGIDPFGLLKFGKN